MGRKRKVGQVKGLALGLKGKVGNDVARKKKRAQVRLGD